MQSNIKNIFCKKHACGCFLFVPCICLAYLQEADSKTAKRLAALWNPALLQSFWFILLNLEPYFSSNVFNNFLAVVSSS